jgi:hypothetical protein
MGPIAKRIAKNENRCWLRDSHSNRPIAEDVISKR